MQLEDSAADAPLLRAISQSFDAPVPLRIGVAVSGGGDSVALLHLFARWAAQTGHGIAAVTVDHRLRPESAAEAQGVAALCAKLNISHDILEWQGHHGAGNLPAAAREGRYGLMAGWARAQGVGGIVLGHTQDDGAENFLMRLGRAAGVDGLAAMQARFVREGIRWARPLAGHSRSALRAYLRRHDVPWVEDPSNDDPRYTRTRVRQVLHGLKDVGIDAAALHSSAEALRQAQEALAHYTRAEAAAHARQDGGDLLIPVQMDPSLPAEIRRRLTVAALQWVGSSPYPPRRTAVEQLQNALVAQQRMTLCGCLVLKRKGHYRIAREYNAVKEARCATDAIWDNRWRMIGPHAPDLEVRALGDAVSTLTGWRDVGVPRASLMASPAVWRGDCLIAAPVAGYNQGWSAQIVADFASFLLSH